MVNNKNTKQAVLSTLLAVNDYVSGEAIAKKLNISRVAVNKAVNLLRNDGYGISSVTNKGYILSALPEIDSNIIKIKSCYDGDVVVVNQTESTNDDAKLIANAGGTVVVIAKTQTEGRGRFEREFSSPLGGVYLSVIVRPDLPITDGVKITTFVAVVIARAIEKLSGLNARIKWVNDVYVNGKKACGILTEANCDFERSKLNYAVIGMGINVNTENFPRELDGIATSIFKESGKKTDCNKLIIEILNGLKNIETEIKSGEYLQEYKNRSFVLGKEVKVVSGQDEYVATAVDITENGALIVNKNGEIITVSSGEVSVKLK